MTFALSMRSRLSHNNPAKSPPWPGRFALQGRLVRATRRRGVRPRAAGPSMQQGNHNMMCNNAAIFVPFRALSAGHHKPIAQKNVSAMEVN